MVSLLKIGGFIALFLSLGIYTFFEEFTYFLLRGLVYGWFEFMKVIIPIAWDLAKEILTELNLSAYISDTWLFIPLETRQAIAFFRIPEVIVILITVGVSKFVFRFVPFSN